MKKNTLSKVLLKEKIDDLSQYYKQYPHKKRIDNIEKIELYLDNQEYKIAVVANMSSGKSTFINALFGEEVLPAFNHATTDCATFIYSKPNIDKRAIIYFSDKKKPIEIIDNIEEEIKQYAQKDVECENKKHTNVEKIELYYPFKNLQTSSSEDFSITFIDTPGPNSTGEDYKQKHKDQTRSVLNDVDLALFMFDYSQLDANLTSDEQGLWNTIKKRHEKDKNFDVYFLLNKIDYALDDNFKEIDTKDKNEFIELKKKHWNIHEKIAIEKLRKAALKHGVSNPKIYPIVSKFQLLSRDNNINWDSEDELDRFQKSHFKRLFPDNWEEKFIEYLGIYKLEQDINTYINSSVKDKILFKVDSQLNGILDDENKDLELRLQTLQKPQEEAEENLKKADDFLNGRAKEMQDEMRKESLKLEDKYIQILETIINNAIENKLINKAEEIAKRTIHFAQAYARGENISGATDDAKKILLSNMKINFESDEVRINIDEEVDISNIAKQMQNFMKNIFEDYKRNYLDVKTDIKEEYFNFEREANQLFSQYKKELESQLENTLDVKIKIIETESIDYNSMLNMDIKIPDSILDYDFKSAEYETISTSSWWNPFSWGDTKQVKISDEQRELIIALKEMKLSIKTSMENSIIKFSDKEKNIHKNNIKTYLMHNTDIFQDFRHIKQKEIDLLKVDIGSIEENLKLIKSQYIDFTKITKVEI